MAQNTDIVMKKLYYYRLFAALDLLNREPARPTLGLSLSHNGLLLDSGAVTSTTPLNFGSSWITECTVRLYAISPFRDRVGACGRSELERQIFDSQVRAAKELLATWEYQDGRDFTAYIPKKVRGGCLASVAGSLCAVGEAFDTIKITALKYWYGRDWRTKIPADDVILAEFPLTVPARIRWGHGAHLVVMDVKQAFAC